MSNDLKTIGGVIDRARQATDPAVFGWANSAAGTGITRARNEIALNRLALVPALMRDSGVVDTSSSFLGVPLAFPVMLAPVGGMSIYDEGDALAAATAATQLGTVAICSTLCDSRWEDVAMTAAGHHFFQLYVFGDRGWLAEVLARVEAAGFAGVCITADTSTIARRDSAIEQGFVWRVDPTGPPNLREHGFDPEIRSRFSWEDLGWVCQQSALPIVLKGVLRAEDVVRAIDCGVSGVYVSNHGGRVVDHSVSSIEMLSGVVDAVGDQVDVVIDSGFTRGAEVCKALALGANAVGIGRLQCWGLAAGGAAGLARTLELLQEEIRITMANIGCRTVSDLTPDHVRWTMPTV